MNEFYFFSLIINFKKINYKTFIKYYKWDVQLNI